MTNDQISGQLQNLNLSHVHRETGLPYRWLRHMKDGAIREPGYDKTTRLREWLLLQASKGKKR